LNVQKFRASTVPLKSELGVIVIVYVVESEILLGASVNHPFLHSSVSNESLSQLFMLTVTFHCVQFTIFIANLPRVEVSYQLASVVNGPVFPVVCFIHQVVKSHHVHTVHQVVPSSNLGLVIDCQYSLYEFL